MKKNVRAAIVVASSLGLVAASVTFVLWFLFYLPLSEEEMSQIQRQHDEIARRGQMIVAAIEEFHDQNGQYPQRLSELVPRYLPALPKVDDLIKYPDATWTYGSANEGFTLEHDGNLPHCAIIYPGTVVGEPHWEEVGELGARQISFEE